MTKKRSTLKDVAKSVGVHASTASRALDPSTRHLISDKLVQEVVKAAEKLDYLPNTNAYSLRTNRSKTIGVLVPDITNFIFPPILRGIEDALAARGYVAFIVNTDSDPQKESRLIDVLRGRGVDGLILASAERQDASITRAAESGISIVTVNRKVDAPSVSSIVNDEESGIEQAARHVLGFGHRRVAHISGPVNISTGLMRLEGFKASAEKHQFEDWPKLIKNSERFNEDEGYRCAQELLEQGEPFTALIAANDRLAIGAIAALSDAGLSCPEDVSVTGFNDMPFADRLQPPLTTVRIRMYEAGERAGNIVLENIFQPVELRCPVHEILPVELVVRGTTGPARSLA